MFQNTVMEQIGRVNMTRGDRLIAESAARCAASAVDLLCRIAAPVNRSHVSHEALNSLFPGGNLS